MIFHTYLLFLENKESRMKKKVIFFLSIVILILSLVSCTEEIVQPISGKIPQDVINKIFDSQLSEYKNYDIKHNVSIEKTDITDGVEKFLLQNNNNKYYLEIRYQKTDQDLKDDKNIIKAGNYYYKVTLYESDWQLFVFDEPDLPTNWITPILSAKELVNVSVLINGNKIIAIQN